MREKKADKSMREKYIIHSIDLKKAFDKLLNRAVVRLIVSGYQDIFPLLSFIQPSIGQLNKRI